ncbi:hypothetical protein Tco_0033674 [Tanacetum coccineum]
MKEVLSTFHFKLLEVCIEEVKYAKEKLGVEFLSDYDCEIRYHPGKANIVVRALSRKERVKPGRLRAMAMTIQSRVKRMILAAQSEAFKEENKPAERLHGLDQQMERADKTYYDLRDMYGGHVWRRILLPMSHVLWAEIREIQLIGPELVQETTSKVILIKEKLKAARDCQKSYEYWTDANMHVPLERIKVHKTLRFVEEPVKIIDREVKSLKPSRISIVKVCWNSKRVKSQDEISLRRGYCDNCALSSYACSDSLLLTPLCCDDIHEVTPCVSALAGCDRLVSEPQVIEKNEFAPHRLPEREGNMNGWLIEDEYEPLGYEASDKDVDLDLESTARSKPKCTKLKKTAKAIPDRTFHNCLYCSK